ncbi:MAG TPA: fatty acyl-AMP ligase [Ktedonobacteraceae bacterium]|jgi:acyl-CoA synthetase (AMP-forming)/AMP-acid ligase II
MIVDISHPAAKTLTFVDVLTQRAREQPARSAYTFLDFGAETETHLTYGQLDQRARAIAVELEHAGYTGKAVLLLYAAGLEYITAFFACLYAGAIAVPVYPPHSPRLLPRLQAIRSDTQAGLALTSTQAYSDILRKFPDLPELQRLQWMITDEPDLAAAHFWKRPDIGGNSLAFLQYTSGSTAVPRGVMVSHGNLCHNSGMIRAQLGLHEQDQGASWLPMFHDMGLIMGVLQPLYTGYHTVLMAPTAFLQRPLRWLQAISEYRASVACAPNFAYDLCARRIGPADRARLDLSCWQLALNGAEPVRYETLQRFGQTFAACGFNPEALLPGYGLAEATLMVSCKRRSTGFAIRQVDKTLLEQHRVLEVAAQSQQAQTLVGCGRVSGEQRVIVVHAETRIQCRSHEIGEIWVAGESVAQGYFGNEEATEYTFGAYLADTGEGPFLRTGDLGFLRDGELFITGRLKDLIIIAGRNHYPQDIEYTVEQCSSVLRSGCVTAFSVEVGCEERLVVVAEMRLAYADLAPEQVAQKIQEVTGVIRQRIAETHEIAVYQVKLVKVGEVPKTSSGKLQRRACRARFLAGSLNAWQELAA